ncbi:DNA repair/transcription protein met18/mms19 [Anaeramoeba ignava]|uniref:MMS19 nucleotide excision repair protein n=1 Tax=Anaeramoeba ignava TaxID=1746090 RepID=A0A9Q0L4Y2_ANAIG|nr:DNA repair/transcription protein met18/mms19 [Anaeramoeba ignava]
MEFFKPLLKQFFEILNEKERDEKFSEIIQLLKEKKILIQQLIEELQVPLTSVDDILRYKALFFLAKILSKLDSSLIDENTIDLFFGFFKRKFQDYSVIPAVIQGIYAIMKHFGLTKKQSQEFIFEIHSHVHVPSLQQKSRIQIAKTILYILKTHLDEIKKNQPNFIEIFIRIMKGEKDPRNILVFFQIFKIAISSFPDNIISKNSQELFNLISCYFPITFEPPKNMKKITNKDLVENLNQCFISTTHFAKYLIPFILDKIDSISVETKTQSFKLFSLIFTQYSEDILAPFFRSIWETFNIEISENLFDKSVLKYALKSIENFLFQLSHETFEKSTKLNEFLQNYLIPSCKESIFNSKNSEQISTGIKLIETACLSSDIANEILFSEFFPLSVSEYQNLNDSKSVYRYLFLKLIYKILKSTQNPNGRIVSNIPYDQLMEIYHKIIDLHEDLDSNIKSFDDAHSSQLPIYAIKGISQLGRLVIFDSNEANLLVQLFQKYIFTQKKTELIPSILDSIVILSIHSIPFQKSLKEILLQELFAEIQKYVDITNSANDEDEQNITMEIQNENINTQENQPQKPKSIFEKATLNDLVNFCVSVSKSDFLFTNIFSQFIHLIISSLQKKSEFMTKKALEISKNLLRNLMQSDIEKKESTGFSIYQVIQDISKDFHQFFFSWIILMMCSHNLLLENEEIFENLVYMFSTIYRFLGNQKSFYTKIMQFYLDKRVEVTDPQEKKRSIFQVNITPLNLNDYVPVFFAITLGLMNKSSFEIFIQNPQNSLENLYSLALNSKHALTRQYSNQALFFLNLKMSKFNNKDQKINQIQAQMKKLINDSVQNIAEKQTENQSDDFLPNSIILLFWIIKSLIFADDFVQLIPIWDSISPKIQDLETKLIQNLWQGFQIIFEESQEMKMHLFNFFTDFLSTNLLSHLKSEFFKKIFPNLFEQLKQTDEKLKFFYSSAFSFTYNNISSELIQENSSNITKLIFETLLDFQQQNFGDENKKTFKEKDLNSINNNCIQALSLFLDEPSVFPSNQVEDIIISLLKTVSEKNPLQVRLSSLKTLSKLALNQFEISENFKQIIIKNLKVALNDKKRIVRKEAIYCRNLFFLGKEKLKKKKKKLKIHNKN